MLKYVWSISIILLCGLLLSMPAWCLDLKPGKYEITSKVDIAGMAGMIPPQTFVQCMDDKTPVPESTADAEGCEVKDIKSTSNTVSYKMECDQQGMKIISYGAMTYHGDSFEGATQMVMGAETGGMTMTHKMAGKRIGDCQEGR